MTLESAKEILVGKDIRFEWSIDYAYRNNAYDFLESREEARANFKEGVIDVIKESIQYELEEDIVQTDREYGQEEWITAIANRMPQNATQQKSRC